MAVKFSFTKCRLEHSLPPLRAGNTCEDEGAQGLFLCVTGREPKLLLVKGRSGKGRSACLWASFRQ